MLHKNSQLEGSSITPLLGIVITSIKLVDVLVDALPIFLKRAKGTMIAGTRNNDVDIAWGSALGCSNSKCKYTPLDPIHILDPNAMTFASGKTPQISTIISLHPGTLHSMVQQGGISIIGI
jgi:hypothetical protein